MTRSGGAATKPKASYRRQRRKRRSIRRSEEAANIRDKHEIADLEAFLADVVSRTAAVIERVGSISTDFPGARRRPDLRRRPDVLRTPVDGIDQTSQTMT